MNIIIILNTFSNHASPPENSFWKWLLLVPHEPDKCVSVKYPEIPLPSYLL